MTNQHQALSSRVTQLCIAEGYPRGDKRSPELIAATEALNAFYVAHPKIVAASKKKVRSWKSRSFRDLT